MWPAFLCLAPIPHEDSVVDFSEQRGITRLGDFSRISEVSFYVEYCMYVVIVKKVFLP